MFARLVDRKLFIISDRFGAGVYCYENTETRVCSLEINANSFT